MRGPVAAGRLGVGRLEELWRVELAGDEDQPAPFLADEVGDHLGPVRTQGAQVGVDHQKGVVLAQLGIVVGQPVDRAVAGLTEAGIGVLDPAGELDMLVAHQGIAQKLHLGRGRPGDQQDADLLADDPHGGRRPHCRPCVSSGPASSARARNSYWPTTRGVRRNDVRFETPSSPSTTR